MESIFFFVNKSEAVAPKHFTKLFDSFTLDSARVDLKLQALKKKRIAFDVTKFKNAAFLSAKLEIVFEMNSWNQMLFSVSSFLLCYFR